MKLFAFINLKDTDQILLKNKDQLISERVDIVHNLNNLACAFDLLEWEVRKTLDYLEVPKQQEHRTADVKYSSAERLALLRQMMDKDGNIIRK